MNYRLKTRVFQILLGVGIVFILASVAQAGSSHHHHGMTDAVSPFDKIHKDKPLHCILNMHQHFLNTPCPHKDQNEKNTGQTIRSDCGPSSGSANSSNLSFAKNLFKNTTHEDFVPLQFSMKISFPFSFKSQYLPRSIDHPPQLA